MTLDIEFKLDSSSSLEMIGILHGMLSHRNQWFNYYTNRIMSCQNS